MKSPLQLFNEIAKEFGVTEDKALHPRQKMAFFSEQANQQRMIANRLMGDLAKARLDMENAKDRVSKNAYQKKVTEYENDLAQIAGALDFFIQMERELNEENPNVQTSDSDIPESD